MPKSKRYSKPSSTIATAGHFGSVLGLALTGALTGTTGCGSGQTGEPTAYEWKLPAGFPKPKVPQENPMSAEKAELGRRLFYDKRLSSNETQSCASCHEQRLAFSDGRANAVGATGVVNRRSSMSLTNAAYNSAQTWANPVLKTLEMQVAVPLLGDDPVELGFSGREFELVDRLKSDARYPELFRAAFPDEQDPLNLYNIVRAIASFERRLISGNSPYDRYAAGEEGDAISESAQRGAKLFFGERFECHHCHGAFAFSNAATWEGKVGDQLFYQNDALYNVDGVGAYPARDQGVYEVTGKAEDMGRFRPPTLRNVAVTAPYMHDGSIATLREVLELHYARGGRLIAEGPDAGDGARSPLKSAFVSGFTIEAREIDDLLAFLESLTDESFLSDPSLGDPFAETPTR
ncbi:MAG TPA: MbnH family di-heme enzyme [Polyangiaceae bacterium]|nr:MbnH family di-heme enzyme [Polyangiaceae bacterium]